MRTLILAGMAMVSVTSATGADAQRIGQPGASYPMPGPGMPGTPPMMNGPTPPMAQPRPLPSRYPGQGYPAPRPTQPYPGQPYPGQPRQGGSTRWGGSIGGHWSGGSSAPGGWNAYRRPSRGWHVPGYWSSPNFFIGDYGSYGLAVPPQGYGWYRYYDDAVLIDGRGRVYDSVDGVDWDGSYGYDRQDGYASGYGYAQGGGGYAAPGYVQLPPPVQHGSVTTYSTGGYGYQGGYYYPPATTTVVTIQPAETITTTTTEYIEQTRYLAPRRVYRAAPKRHYRIVRRRCSCERPIQGS